MSHSKLPHSIKSEIKKCLSLTTPLVASQLIYASSGFIGTIMVAHLSEAALAASVLVNMIWFSLSVLFFGILNAVSVLVSHQHGAKNKDAIRDIMGQSYLLGIGMFFVMLCILINTPYLLNLSDSSADVLHLSKFYIQSLIWTVPGLIVLIISEQFLAGIGETKLVLRISLLVVPLEIPLIYLLVFGKFGLPKCGIAGVGYGLAISYAISGILLVLYLVYSKRYRDYKILSGVNKINWSYQRELIRIGMPMGMMHLIEVSAFAITTLWMGHFGTTVLAAHQIVMQFLGFAITIVFAMSQAVTIRVGHEVGRQDLTGVKYAIYIGMLVNFCIMLLIAIALFAFPEIFLRIDLNTADPTKLPLVKIAAGLLGISAALMLFDNFRIIGFGALRGLKDTAFPMYSSFVSFWLIGVSAAYFLAFTLDWKASGIWWGLTVGIAAGAVILFIRLQYVLAHVDLASLLEITANKFKHKAKDLA